MKTPKEYTKNLKKHIITEDMFVDCLYSVNKRAKNFRDKAQSYRYNPYYRGYYQTEDMDRYYGYKDQFLSLLTPVCIHKQNIGYETRRVYDYEKDYRKMNNRNIVWQNCYYDRDEDREVWFYDYETKTKRYLYFLYYVVGDKSFHKPISSPSGYDLPIKAIDDDFMTFGQDTKDLISPQFVLKVLDMLLNQTCELHINGQIIKRTEKEKKEVIEKSRSAQEATANQLDYIAKICDFYKLPKPDPKTKGQASTWIRTTLEDRNFAADKRKAETQKRNQELLDAFDKGQTVNDLAVTYNLKPRTVRSIISASKNCKSK